MTYTNASIATPSVTYNFDSVYPRLTSMVDGTGTTAYTYRTVGQLARSLSTDSSRLILKVIMEPSDQIDQTFLRHYKCQVLSELPNQELKRFYYPGAKQEGGRDGLLVKVAPQGGDPWIGMFGFGEFSGPTKVYSCPDEKQICVVSRGDGYIVPVEDPSQYERVKASPVLGVYPARHQGLIVFHDFTNFVAYGKTGLAWRSKRISYDGIKGDRFDGEFLVGQSWDAPTGKDVGFRLNLRTGTHEGGAYPSD